MHGAPERFDCPTSQREPGVSRLMIRNPLMRTGGTCTIVPDRSPRHVVSASARCSRGLRWQQENESRERWQVGELLADPNSRATERRGCAFLMSPQIYGILARAALVSCSVNARSVSVRMLPSDPTA